MTIIVHSLSYPHRSPSVPLIYTPFAKSCLYIVCNLVTYYLFNVSFNYFPRARINNDSIYNLAKMYVLHRYGEAQFLAEKEPQR